MGTLAVLGRPSAASGTMPPLPESNFFEASVTAAAARGVTGRAAIGCEGVPASRETRDDDIPAADAHARPPRLLGRLHAGAVASVEAAVEGAGGELSSLRREIPSERLGEMKENKDQEIEKRATTAAAPHSLSRASRPLHSGAYSAPQIPGSNRRFCFVF